MKRHEFRRWANGRRQRHPRERTRLGRGSLFASGRTLAALKRETTLIGYGGRLSIARVGLYFFQSADTKREPHEETWLELVAHGGKEDQRHRTDGLRSDVAVQCELWRIHEYQRTFFSPISGARQ